MIIEYEDVQGSSEEFYLDTFFKRKNLFVKVNPGNVIMPRAICEIGDDICKFSVQEKDIWMVSYPRSGSTWAMEMVWLLANKLDYEGAKQLQAFRAPLLELTAFFKKDQEEWHNSIVNSVEFVKSLSGQRFIKSHLPWQLLPSELDKIKPKIIYVARNPKDLCVSLFHYCVLIHGPVGTFAEFFELFLTDHLICGSMWSHVLEFWKRRNEPNILFLKYEDMKKDLQTTIKQCAEFIGLNASELNKSDIDRLCDYLKFEKMQNNKAVNLDEIIHAGKNKSETNECQEKFIRKGQIGDWKNYFTREMSDRFDKWIAEHSKDTGLCFEYE